MRRYKITTQGIKTRKKLRWKFTFRSLPYAKYDVLDNLMRGSRTRKQLWEASTVRMREMDKAISALLNSGDIVIKT